MKIARILLLLFFPVFTASIAHLHAQNPASQPLRKISLGNDKKSDLFVNGRTIIAELEYTGFDFDNKDYGIYVDKAIYESDFVKALREQRASIRIDELFSEEKVEKVLRMLKEWLASRGYLKATVLAYGTKLPKDRMKLRFSLEKGPLIRVAEIRFVGNRNISSDEFLEDLKKCLKDEWEQYDSRVYEYYSQKCSRQLMYSKGYFRAKIHSVTAKLIGDGYHVKIVIEEGIRYRWGEMKIEGTKSFSYKEILEMFGHKAGDIADGRDLQDFVYERLKREYGEKGHVLYNAEFEPEFVEPLAEGVDGSVNLHITIEEGKKFTIRRIIFTGINGNEERSLKEGFTLKEGGLFVPSKLESWVDQINKTERFYFVDKDQHVEIRTDEEEGDLDLVINLKKFQP